MTSLIEKFLFFPDKTLAYYPSSLDLPWEDIFINSGGNQLHGWLIPGPRADRLMIFAHGNAGNIADRLGKLRELHKLGVSLMIFDYRGYGGSEGKPSLAAIQEDMDTVYQTVLQWGKYTPGEILLYGESLGGGVVVDLAAREPVGAVILESTFTSLKELGRLHYSVLGNVVSGNALNVVEKIRHLQSPLLVVHGTDDEICPYPMAQQLYAAAPHPKRIETIAGAHHNDVYEVGGAAVITAIEKFLSETGN